jgi:hypothetical protein
VTSGDEYTTVYDRFADASALDSPESALSVVARADPTNIQEVAASQLAITNSYYRSVLGQARQSFVAAVVAASAGLAFFGVSVAVTLRSSNVSAAALSALGGIVVEVISGLNFWLYSRASAQLGAFHLRLEDTQRFLLANSVCESLGAAERDATRALLVRTIIGAPDDARQAPAAIDLTPTEGTPEPAAPWSPGR